MFSLKKIILIIFLLTPFVVSAKIYPEDIIVTVTPENPEANKEVTVNMKSFAADTDRSVIIWTVNGKQIKNGVGEKEIQIKTGDVGTETRIVITVIDSETKESVNKTISISPAIIDIVWQSQAYVPAFYKGKALFPHQGTVTLTAIPTIVSKNGAKINADNLIYKWKKDGVVLGSLSGYGKKTLTLSGEVISRPIIVSAEVSTTDGSSQGAKEIILNPQEANINLYRNSSTLGILFNKALKNIHEMSGREIEIIAVPYNFSVNNKNSTDLEYKWTMNGGGIEGGSDSKIFRINDDQTGSSEIGTSIRHKSKILQFSSEEIVLKYNSKN